MNTIFDEGADLDRRDVIFVGDDHEDAFLFQEALAEQGGFGEAVHCPTIEACRGYLRAKAAEGGLPGVAAVLVDLALPGARGVGLLRELKQSHDTAALPVVMLADSDHPAVPTCRSAGAEQVLDKPADLAGFERLVGGLKTVFGARVATA